MIVGSSLLFTVFSTASAGSQNITTLLVTRFLASALGSSPLTNGSGVIADIFPSVQRGLISSLFAAGPFLGPALGPICLRDGLGLHVVRKLSHRLVRCIHGISHGCQLAPSLTFWCGISIIHALDVTTEIWLYIRPHLFPLSYRSLVCLSHACFARLGRKYGYVANIPLKLL